MCINLNKISKHTHKPIEKCFWSALADNSLNKLLLMCNSFHFRYDLYSWKSTLPYTCEYTRGMVLHKIHICRYYMYIWLLVTNNIGRHKRIWKHVYWCLIIQVTNRYMLYTICLFENKQKRAKSMYNFNFVY